MQLLDFYTKVEQQYSKKLPFVIYSRPIQNTLKCWLQQDDVLYKTSDFSETGFVFSPFNSNKDTILLPKHKSEFLEISVDYSDNENFSNETSNNATPKNENDLGKQAHVLLVEKGIEAIHKNEFEKVVLSRQIALKLTDTESNPITVFKKLFNQYSNAMVYCWYHPKVGLWLGATPELLFKIEGNLITTISLAGTQSAQKSNNPVWTEKEKHEQQIVTDFIEDQLKPFSKDIKISGPETIKAGQLYHLKSRVIGRLKTDVKIKDVIEKLHPTPAVCGMPKQTAKTFILKQENYDRAFYTGFLGELNIKQTISRSKHRRNTENTVFKSIRTQSNFYVNLRCMQLKDNKAFIYVGGGITKGSIPEKEWEETQNKSKTMINMLQ